MEDEENARMSVRQAPPVDVPGHPHLAPASEQVHNASDCLLLLPDDADKPQKVEVVRDAK